ncbi:SLX8 protein [Ophiocordyceps sinensis CO18]|uniref:SLX8 protein n=1 Tax=Ophiocordyceps sinensis (strain Co18 / CGMCC 3.14243) TaxID=911162 RepID=T5AIW3_OPHSC|nr:SLX8 protein [Ophiocordyceps sinensis CO18]
MATAAGLAAELRSPDQTRDEQLLLPTAARSPSNSTRDSWHSALPPLPQQPSPLVWPDPQTQSHHFDRDSYPPVDDWGDDSADEFPLVMSADPLHDAAFDDQFLAALADNDFSSPSSYPSFLNPFASSSPPADQGSRQHQLAATHDTASGPHARRPSVCLGYLASSSRSTARSAGASRNSLFTNVHQASPPEETQSARMPSPALRDAPNIPARAPASKRRRVSRTGGRLAQPKPLALPMPYDDDLFADEQLPQEADDMSGLTTLDLTEANEVPEELMKPKVDNRVKISAFQCAICMDNVTTLTVTHCGHLYCQQCLHSSLNVESTRGKCPMCRTKIDMKVRSSYSTRTKGFWPLELKLMTTTRKGKRKAASTP